MKAKFSLSLDLGLLREVRRLAAQRGTSVSAILETLLREIVNERKNYNRARQRALARLRKGMNLGWKPSESRCHLYER